MGAQGRLPVAFRAGGNGCGRTGSGGPYCGAYFDVLRGGYDLALRERRGEDYEIVAGLAVVEPVGADLDEDAFATAALRPLAEQLAAESAAYLEAADAGAGRDELADRYDRVIEASAGINFLCQQRALCNMGFSEIPLQSSEDATVAKVCGDDRM